MCAHKLCLCSEKMAGALVRRDIHLVLFDLLFNIQDAREEVWQGAESREDSVNSSLTGPGEGGERDGVESEKDCESVGSTRHNVHYKTCTLYTTVCTLLI